MHFDIYNTFQNLYLALLCLSILVLVLFLSGPFSSLSLTASSAWRGGYTLDASKGDRCGISVASSSTLATTICSPHSYTRYVTDYYMMAISGNMNIQPYINPLSPGGGYLCKKYRTAPSFPRIGYNLGTCFPSLPSSGNCPTGWYEIAIKYKTMCSTGIYHLIKL